MTQAQENFLNILRTALHHEQAGIQLPGNQWKKILKISIKQHLLPVIAEVIPWTQEDFPENDVLIYRQYAIRQTTTEAGRYPYAGKYPLLLPIAWGSSIWGYLCEIRKDDSSSASDSLHLAKERIALLKYYGVIS